MFKRVFVSALFVSAGLASAEPATYAIDPLHTIATFEALHMGTSTQRGRIMAKEGTVTIDKAAKTGKADVTLDLGTISVAGSGLEGFLKGARAFNVAQFPTARFVGTSMTFDGDKVATVTGTLSAMDKSEPVTLKAVRYNCYENGQLKREVCGGDFQGVVQRGALGLGFLPNVTPDDIPVLLQIEGIKTQ